MFMFLVLHGISQFLAWFRWYMVKGAHSRVCVCLCALLTGMRSGEMVGKGVMKVVLPHSYVIKAKFCLSSCLYCQLYFFDTTNTFCIRCSTRSFDRVVRYVLGKALKAVFPRQYVLKIRFWCPCDTYMCPL